jgi:hypothetical protein
LHGSHHPVLLHRLLGPGFLQQLGNGCSCTTGASAFGAFGSTGSLLLVSTTGCSATGSGAFGASTSSTGAGAGFSATGSGALGASTTSGCSATGSGALGASTGFSAAGAFALRLLRSILPTTFTPGNASLRSSAFGLFRFNRFWLFSRWRSDMAGVFDQYLLVLKISGTAFSTGFSGVCTLFFSDLADTDLLGFLLNNFIHSKFLQQCGVHIVIQLSHRLLFNLVAFGS